jgi:hypothetical protein
MSKFGKFLKKAGGVLKKVVNKVAAPVAKTVGKFLSGTGIPVISGVGKVVAGLGSGLQKITDTKKKIISANLGVGAAAGGASVGASGLSGAAVAMQQATFPGIQTSSQAFQFKKPEDESKDEKKGSMGLIIGVVVAIAAFLGWLFFGSKRKR